MLEPEYMKLLYCGEALLSANAFEAFLRSLEKEYGSFYLLQRNDDKSIDFITAHLSGNIHGEGISCIPNGLWEKEFWPDSLKITDFDGYRIRTGESTITRFSLVMAEVMEITSNNTLRISFPQRSRDKKSLKIWSPLKQRTEKPDRKSIVKEYPLKEEFRKYPPGFLKNLYGEHQYEINYSGYINPCDEEAAMKLGIQCDYFRPLSLWKD